MDNDKIKSVASTSIRGTVMVSTKDNRLFFIKASDTKGVMPKLGELITKYKTEFVDVNPRNAMHAMKKVKSKTYKNPSKPVKHRINNKESVTKYDVDLYFNKEWIFQKSFKTEPAATKFANKLTKATNMPSRIFLR